ncbi:MAG: hypothetical protein R6V76_06415, partial [Desulfobacterales bacterium]
GDGPVERIGTARSKAEWINRKRKNRRDENYSSFSGSPPVNAKAHEHLVGVFRRSEWWELKYLPVINHKPRRIFRTSSLYLQFGLKT